MDGSLAGTGWVVGVFAGLPRVVDGGPDAGPTWTTGLFKDAVTALVRVTATGLAGDGQADLVHHGGPDKAVLAYAASHYPAWVAETGLAMGPGGLGENLAVEGLDERTVCIGDSWAVGTVVLQVTQPRTPCWKLERRWGLEGLIRRILETARTGWYLRVMREGEVAVGMAVTLESRPHPDWTVARALRARVSKTSHPEEAMALAALPELSAAWRADLAHAG